MPAKKSEMFSHPIRKLSVEEIERVHGGKKQLIERASSPKSYADVDNQIKNFSVNHP